MAEQRVIKYGDRTMPLEPGMTLEQAKELMARHFPELADPKVETKKDGEKTTYVFTKKAGRKGAGRRQGHANEPAVKRLLQIRESVGVDCRIVEYVKKDLAHTANGEDYLNASHLAGSLREEAERVHEIGSALFDLPSALPPTGSVL